MSTVPFRHNKYINSGKFKSSKTGQKSQLENRSQRGNSKSFGHIESISNLLIKEA